MDALVQVHQEECTNTEDDVLQVVDSSQDEEVSSPSDDPFNPFNLKFLGPALPPPEDTLPTFNAKLEQFSVNEAAVAHVPFGQVGDSSDTLIDDEHLTFTQAESEQHLPLNESEDVDGMECDPPASTPSSPLNKQTDFSPPTFTQENAEPTTEPQVVAVPLLKRAVVAPISQTTESRSQSKQKFQSALSNAVNWGAVAMEEPSRHDPLGGLNRLAISDYEKVLAPEFEGLGQKAGERWEEHKNSLGIFTTVSIYGQRIDELKKYGMGFNRDMSGGMGGGMGIRNAGMSMDRGGGGGGGGARMDYEQRGRDQQQRDPRDHYNDDVRASSVQSRRGGYSVPNSRGNEGRGDARGGSTYGNSGDARGDGGYNARNSSYSGNFEARGNFPSQQPQGVDANSGYSASSSKNQALPQGTYGNADWDSAYDTPSNQTAHVFQQATASFDQTRKYDMNELKAIGQKQVPAPFKDVPYLYVGPEPVVVREPPVPIRSKNPTSTGQDSRNTPAQSSNNEMPDIPSLLAKRTVDLDAPKVPFQPKHVFLSGDGVYNPKAGRAAGGMQNQQGQGGMQQQRQPQGFVGYGGGGNSGGIVHNQQQGGMPQQVQKGEIGSGENRGSYGGGDRDSSGFGSGGGAKGVPAHRGGLYQGGGDDAGIYKGGSAPVFASSGSDDVDEWA